MAALDSLLPATTRRSPRPVLVFVEGYFDIDFLKGISVVLHTTDPGLPDLVHAEAEGRLIFIPAIGVLDRWAWRFAALALPEFHLYDREVEPLTGERRRLVTQINMRPGCTAQLTGYRSLENYLHPQAIHEVCGVTVAVGPLTDVASAVGEQLRRRRGATWQGLKDPARRRLRNRVKGQLNTAVVAMMTEPRLAEQDPEGEVTGWLRTIGALLVGPNT